MCQKAGVVWLEAPQVKPWCQPGGCGEEPSSKSVLTVGRTWFLGVVGLRLLPLVLRCFPLLPVWPLLLRASGGSSALPVLWILDRLSACTRLVRLDQACLGDLPLTNDICKNLFCNRTITGLIAATITGPTWPQGRRLCRGKVGRVT